MYVRDVPSTVRVLDVLPRMPARVPHAAASDVGGETADDLSALELLPQWAADAATSDKKSRPTRERTLMGVLRQKGPSRAAIPGTPVARFRAREA